MPYPTYDEEMITSFITHAQEMGIGPAMRYLGYPKSYHTAKKFFVERNIETPTANTLAVMAKNLDIFYTDKEKILAAQAVIDTNNHGIRRETNLDSLYKESQKKKAKANKPYRNYKKKDKDTKLGIAYE